MIEVFDIPEVCKRAHQGRTGVYQAINDGKLVAHKRGSRTIIFASDLQRYLEALPQIEVKASPKGADNCAGEVPSAPKCRGAT
jgi:hypothetical protein